MPAPCRKCGATKTEPVHRGVFYELVRTLGYRLRKCSRCRRWRIVPESVFKRPARQPSPTYSGRTSPQAGAERPTVPTQWEAGDFDPDGFDGCPRCGNPGFDRTPRNWLERGLGLAHMARCRACGKRFAYPQP